LQEFTLQFGTSADLVLPRSLTILDGDLPADDEPPVHWLQKVLRRFTVFELAIHRADS
jgi:hypothetical protein